MIKGISTGFKRLDEVTRGLWRGDLAVISGPPGAGKTTLALSMMLRMAKGKDNAIIIFTAGPEKTALLHRMLAMEAKVSLRALRGGYLPREDCKRLAQATDWLTTADLFIYAPARVHIEDIREKIVDAVDNHAIKVIFLDSLHLLCQKRPVEEPREEMGRLARDLKLVAKEFQIPVVVLSQEAGENVSRHADIVLSVKRNPDKEHREGHKVIWDEARVVVEKNNNGPTGTVELAHVRKYEGYTEDVINEI